MTTPAGAPRCLAVMPAGGTGSRLGAALPKQYLELAGEPMIARAARALLAAPWLERLVVVVAADDARAAGALAGLPRTTVLGEGGATRRDTVLAGLRWLARAQEATPDDWVLVHDAARPGLDRPSLERLRESLAADPVGGLLALPVSDTVKRSTPHDPAGLGDAGPAEHAGQAGASATRVAQTVPREDLWLAQTPQMFRLGPLLGALERFPDVTDESAAIERAGLAPKLVPGSRANFKVTTAEDLDLMRRLLAAESAPEGEARTR